MWTLAFVAFVVIAIFCVVVFVHGASTTASRRRTRLDVDHAVGSAPDDETA